MDGRSKEIEAKINEKLRDAMKITLSNSSFKIVGAIVIKGENESIVMEINCENLEEGEKEQTIQWCH